MTNLSKPHRAELATAAELETVSLVAEQVSELDGTCKYLFELKDGERIESALIWEADRSTLCVSSQVGCGQDCSFCATAQMGLRRNLTVGEIVGQVLRVEARIGVGAITNIVFMGMGEPLANYTNLVRSLGLLSARGGLGIGARRIIVSTSGLVPAIRRFTRERLSVGLALSLNATTDETRNRLIPSNRRYKITAVLDACAEWSERSNRRLTIEYVLLRDVNDSTEDAYRLTRLLRSIPSKVNLIPYNPIPNGPFERPERAQVEAFQRILHDARIVATVRKTKGQDISAACGQLRADYKARH